MPKSTCSVAQCGRGVKSRKLCSLHYQRWLHWGDARPDLPVGVRRAAGRICAIDGCDLPALARSWCAAHYQRWSSYGDPLGGGTFRRPRRRRSLCVAPGCQRESKIADLCGMHYQRHKLNGSFDPASKKPCSVDVCDKQVFSANFCRNHWNRWKEFGDPGKYRQCSIEGCVRYAPSGKRSWCVMHYTRWSKHGALGAASPRFFEPPRPAADGHQWCTTCRVELPIAEFARDKTTRNGHARVCRTCAKDVRLPIYYGIDVATYRRLHDEQGGVCRICCKPETATHQSGTLRRLAIDHDHKCCPGQRSCGKCVRGLLCARCNSAIGLLDEDLTIVENVASYLRGSWRKEAAPDQAGSIAHRHRG